MVAEGVETRELADWLAGIGCDMGQGSLWSSAVPPHTLLEMKTHAHEPRPTVVQLHNRRSVNECDAGRSVEPGYRIDTAPKFTRPNGLTR